MSTAGVVATETSDNVKLFMLKPTLTRALHALHLQARVESAEMELRAENLELRRQMLEILPGLRAFASAGFEARALTDLLTELLAKCEAREHAELFETQLLQIERLQLQPAQAREEAAKR